MGEIINVVAAAGKWSGIAMQQVHRASISGVAICVGNFIS